MGQENPSFNFSKKLRGLKEKLNSYFNNENVILDQSHLIQERIESFKSPLEAENELVKRMNAYGRVVLSKEPINSRELFNIYKTTVANLPFRNRELDKIELSYDATTPDNDPKFKKKVGEFLKKESKDAVISFLFYKIRDETSKPFDKEKELRLIRGVYHQLAGDHPAMYTGDGKSTIVAPFCTIIESLFENKNAYGYPTIIDSSADERLTLDLRNNLSRNIKIIKNSLKDRILDPNIRLEIKNKLALISPVFQEEESVDVQADNPLEQALAQPTFPYDWQRTYGSTIHTQPHDKLIFDSTALYLAEMEKIIEGLPEGERDYAQISKRVGESLDTKIPKFIIDEAHLANRTSYKRHYGEHQKTPVDLDIKYPFVRDSLANYIVLRLAHDIVLGEGKVANRDLLIIEGGVNYLTGKGKKELYQLRQTLVDNIGLYLSDKRKQTGLVKKVKRLIKEEIIGKYDIKGKDIEGELMAFLQTAWGEGKDSYAKVFEENKRDLPQGKEIRLKINNQIFEMLFNDYLKTVTSLTEGQDYITPEVLRDNLRGTLLKNRQFVGQTSFYLHTFQRDPLIKDQSSIVNQIDFGTWVGLVARGNVVCLSNDLIYTDPITGSREVTPLGKLLEKHTKGRVVDLAPKKEVSELIPISDPIITKDGDHLMDKIVGDILARKESRPELIINWDENKAQELFEKFNKELSGQGKRIALINSETSDDEAEKLQKQFSNYEIDFLITTGRKSYGSDFKDSKGKFTDIRVTVINPETIFQIAQAFGRRRLSKTTNDFSIYFESEFLLDMATNLSQDKPINLFPFLNKILGGRLDTTYPEFEQLAKKSLKGQLTDNQKTTLKENMISILRRSQNKINDDWEKTIEFETLFIERFAPIIKEQKRQIIEHKWRNPNHPINKIIDEELNQSLSQQAGIDLPWRFKKDLEAKIQQTVFSFFSGIEEDIYRDYQNQITSLSYYPQLGDNIMAQKNILMEEFDKKIKDEYTPIWNYELDDGNSRYLQVTLRQKIQEQIIIQLQLLNFVSQELEKKGLSLDDIEKTSIMILDAPFYRVDKSKPLFYQEHDLPEGTEIINVAHNQKLCYIKDSKSGEMILLLYDKNNNIYWQVDKKTFEAQLSILHQYLPGSFDNKKTIDLYYPSDNMRKFVRVVMMDEKK
ncbi:MAG: hypothetical protein WC744_02710 [Patescibacteria group bacterium]|jgi:hypothetical protein